MPETLIEGFENEQSLEEANAHIENKNKMLQEQLDEIEEKYAEAQNKLQNIIRFSVPF